MSLVLDVIGFPLICLIEAFVGILYDPESPRMRRNRRFALVSLAASAGTFGLLGVDLMIEPASASLVPLIVIGAVFLFAFVITGMACSREAEKGKK